MDNPRVPELPGQVDDRLTPTLQAVLLATGGTMESIAVPLPLPEMIVRLPSQQPATPTHGDGAPSVESPERWFRRARSSDSVLRYLEEDALREEPGAALPEQPRCCPRCHQVRAAYFVAKASAAESHTSPASAYCESCYCVTTPLRSHA
jgi:hypothetical protein